MAGTLLALALIYVLAVKFVRGSSDALAPLWLAGVLPNLFGAALVPLVLFLSSRAVTLKDFLMFVVIFAIALSGYEVAQIWMPRRSFDWYDLLATAIGALIAAGLGPALFLRRPSETGMSGS
jgi:hypothetical protein